MHEYIYVSTDPAEAQHILEPNTIIDGMHGESLDVIVGQKYIYHNVTPERGEVLREEIGFSPMCTIEIRDSTKKRECDYILNLFVRHGLFVGYNRDGCMHMYMPNDMKLRDIIMRNFVTLKDDKFKFVLYLNNPPINGDE